MRGHFHVQCVVLDYGHQQGDGTQIDHVDDVDRTCTNEAPRVKGG